MTAAPTDPHLGLVVEGPGDAKALPEVLRTWLYAEGEYRDVLGKPISCNGRDKALPPNGLEGFVSTAVRRPGCRGLLIVLDSEGDDVRILGPALERRASTQTALPVGVVLAEVSFEDWLFSSAESLDLPELKWDVAMQGQAAIKAALRPAKYVKPTLQPRLASKVDLELASSRSRSFRRLLKEFSALHHVLLGV